MTSRVLSGILTWKAGDQMARGAREKDIYGIYHIHQQGGSQRPLFLNSDDREKWLRIVGKAREKYRFKLYAYCASHQNEYHLVINLQGGDISKVMKSINIAYAMYAQCTGRLFRDRYRSQLIETREALLALLASIHLRSVATRQSEAYNSFCCYRGDDTQKFVPVDTHDIKTLENATETVNLEKNSCETCIQSVGEAEQALRSLLSENMLTLEMLHKDKEHRNRLIRRFRKSSTLTLKELGKLFGGLSESAVSKIISNY